MRKLPNICFLFTITVVLLSTACSPKSKVLENDAVYLEFNDDLSGIKSLLDKKTGFEYASTIDSSLYALRFGENYRSGSHFTASMASVKEFRKVKGGVELRYSYEGEVPFKVVCSIASDKNTGLLHWAINVENNSDKALIAIEYPIITCNNLPSKPGEMAGVLYPFLEGVLLTGMNQPGTQFKHNYPGQISAQVLYYFNTTGGLYYACHDGSGYQKNIATRNNGNGVSLTQEFMLPVEYQKDVVMPYKVVTGFAGGRWEDGASIYRNWAKQQEWCAQTLQQRTDIVDWLKKPNLLVNYSYALKDFATVENADKLLKNYSDFFEMPVLATGFGWEKNQIWMGPDYFPPLYGEDYYRELAGRLKERGDHLFVFTSGFRWAVKKPVNYPDGTTGFTDYDGTADFMNRGKIMATINSKGEMIFDARAWAHNYILCAGSDSARELIKDIYNRLWDMGIRGIDLDQNLGGEVDECFSADHGHPKGNGLWQYQVMQQFFTEARENGKRKSEDIFMGVEEPIEIFMPQLDLYHGRAYTDTEWPVMGPGGVAVPLFLYLYHPYTIAYSGWIDWGFSPFNDVKPGLGRSFIFGMYPGVRTSDSYNQNTGIFTEQRSFGIFDLLGGVISDELKMLKSYTELYKAYPEFFVHGEMMHELKIEGCDTIAPAPHRHKKLPVTWDAVQGIAWKSPSGEEVLYAIANLTATDYPKLELMLDGASNSAEMMVYDYDKDEILTQPVTLNENGKAGVSLKPYQFAVIRKKL
jgi:hypothetical protein